MSAQADSTGAAGRWWRHAVVGVGVLPLLLAIALITFSLLSPHFLTGQNLLNVARQSTFLAMVATRQLLALLPGGFDLSVGKTLAITSVVGALAMAGAKSSFP